MVITMLKGMNKHEDKEQGKSLKREAPRSINHKATENKNNIGAIQHYSEGDRPSREMNRIEHQWLARLCQKLQARHNFVPPPKGREHIVLQIPVVSALHLHDIS